jgi:DNA-binding Xre family transcriptional regulator
MSVSYKKLFHIMIERDMTNAELLQQTGFSAEEKCNGYKNKH